MKRVFVILLALFITMGTIGTAFAEISEEAAAFFRRCGFSTLLLVVFMVLIKALDFNETGIMFSLIACIITLFIVLAGELNALWVIPIFISVLMFLAWGYQESIKKQERDNVLRKYEMERGNDYRPRCPKCGSSNYQNIHGAVKGISFFALGPFAANTILNNYKCKVCGEKFNR